MTKAAAFVIDPVKCTVVGFVANPKIAAEKAGYNHVVQQAKDLEDLSMGTLGDLRRAFSDGALKPFENGTKRTEAAQEVYDLLLQKDIAEMIQLDAEEKAQVETQAKVKKSADASQPKERKVRDSKLQRMAAAFREQDENGHYKLWTIEELEQRCGTTGTVTKGYISILRAQNDRFVMPITKFEEVEATENTPALPVRYQYTPQVE